MRLTSSAFEHNQLIPPKFTCDGENVSPDLHIQGVPKNTVSLVLIVDDPDAPAKVWVHWTLWNISSGVEEIAVGGIPKGSVEGITDFGTPGYGGPCPPDGEHRYFFKLYALDTMLNLPQSATKDQLLAAMEGHVIEQSELIGLYSK